MVQCVFGSDSPSGVERKTPIQQVGERCESFHLLVMEFSGQWRQESCPEIPIWFCDVYFAYDVLLLWSA